MAKKSKSSSNKSQDIGSNMTIIIALALLIMGYYTITHWFISGIVVILLLIVAGIGLVGYYFKGSALWLLSSLTKK